MQKYYFDAKEFALLVFQTKFTEEDLKRMHSLAFNIHEKYRQFTHIHCKIHHILHYADLIRKYGPLYLYCTWRMERKHQFSKHVARIMRNFRNPPLTIHRRHQFKKASYEEKNDFASKNFFPQVSDYKIMDENDPSIANKKFTSLPSQERKIALGKFVLRKCLAHSKTWIQPKFMFRASDGSVIVQGPVYTKKRCTYNKECGMRNFALKKLHKRRFIDIRGLHHSNDFIDINKDIEEDDEEEKLFKYLLVRWIM